MPAYTDSSPARKSSPAGYHGNGLARTQHRTEGCLPPAERILQYIVLPPVGPVPAERAPVRRLRNDRQVHPDMQAATQDPVQSLSQYIRFLR